MTSKKNASKGRKLKRFRPLFLTLAVLEAWGLILIMPFMPRLQGFIALELGTSLGFLPEICFGALATVLFVLVYKRTGWKTSGELLIFIVMMLIGFEHLSRFPVEKFHPIAYATFASLLYFGLLNRKKPLKALVLTLTIGTLFGLAEEGMQYFVPGRYCDLLDAGSNIAGIIYGTALSRLVLQKAFWTSQSK